MIDVIISEAETGEYRATKSNQDEGSCELPYCNNTDKISTDTIKKICALVTQYTKDKNRLTIGSLGFPNATFNLFTFVRLDAEAHRAISFPYVYLNLDRKFSILYLIRLIRLNIFNLL